MKTLRPRFVTLLAIIVVIVCCQGISLAQSSLDCGLCHSGQKSLWLTGRHAQTQTDVASELAISWKGQRPDSVILGSQAEDCVACHGPTSVTTGTGLTEVQVMAHFFTTKGGVFTDSTTVADTTQWPHVACGACHDVPSSHPAAMPAVSAFNSTTAKYDLVLTSSQLCGKCHGTLRFSGTDHQVFDAWQSSGHGHGGQRDLVSELASSWAGQSPDSVINGSQAENCVACHAPTAVNRRTGTTEVQVLSHFFTTTSGRFTAQTTTADSLHWPDVSCTACHNPHNPGTLSFFNSVSGGYQSMTSSDQLCGQCHGRLHFPDTDHGTYDVASGTGGRGIPNKVTMTGVKCVDCHMHKTDADESNSKNYKGHSWSVFIQEPDGSTATACTKCHRGLSADSAAARVAAWKEETAQLDSTAQWRIDAARAFLGSHRDTLKLRYLDEAQYNLAYAELDEGGGVHNHLYVKSLLNDAIEKATLIVSGIQDQHPQIVPTVFSLFQNYPNPFNPSTTIHYELPKAAYVSLVIFNTLGQVVGTLLDERKEAGSYTLQWHTQLPSGVYFYRLQARPTDGQTNEYVETRKLVLLR